MSMGGGGGSGNTTTTQKFEPPENTRAGWDAYMQAATGLSGRPYQSSGIPTVAPFNDFQQTSQNLLYDRALNGAPDLNAGRAAVTGIASGNQANPWQAYLSGTASGGNVNPFMSGAAGLAGGSNNPFMAMAQSMAGGKDNPYMIDPEAMIKATADDMTTNAQRGVMAQTDAMANRGGAYGGSAWQNLQAQNQGELARGIGSMSASARQAANAANSQMWQQGQQNQLNAMGLGGGMFNSGIGQQLQAMGLGGNMFSTGLGQQIQSALGGGQMFGNDINNMLSAAGLSGQLSQDDWTSINQLMQGGNTYGQYQQALLNAGNQDFQSQYMFPWAQNEMFGGALTRASGQGGSSSSTMAPPGYNNYWNAAGAGLGLLGMMGGG